MSELKIGDIFTYELKFSGRVAYRVDEIKQRKTKDDKYLICTNRNTGKKVEKTIFGHVMFLRHE